MPGKSPFSDDWRDCLQAHYTHVIRVNDQRTEKTLRSVLHECGFNDADLKEWYVLATMHVDDVPPDFVPDVELLQPESSASIESPPEALIESLEADEEPPDEASDPPPEDKSGYQQLSMF